MSNLWDEEVTKTRARLYAERHPNPPLPGWAKIVIFVAGLAALLAACQAWKLMIG
jgi:hypothetical protein